MTKLAKGKLARLTTTTPVRGTRLATHDDYLQWRESGASKGMTSAGETKLPPTAYTVMIHPDRVYTVLRARTAGHWGYRRRPGQALILDTETGHEVYVKRERLEAV